MDNPNLGPGGKHLADVMAQKIIDTIENFPTPNEAEKKAIAQEVAHQLADCYEASA